MMPPREEGRLLQALALAPRDHLLEVGTGSGYLAALAAGLARRVTTVEIAPERKARAERSLADYDNVEVIEGDAVRGWEADAPYDAIAVTGSPSRARRRLPSPAQAGRAALRGGGPRRPPWRPASSPGPGRRTGPRRASSRRSSLPSWARSAPTSSNSEQEVPA